MTVHQLSPDTKLTLSIDGIVRLKFISDLIICTNSQYFTITDSHGRSFIKGVVHGIYRGIRNYRINSSFVFFSKKQEKIKQKITYKVSYCGLDG
jgi:hypothetical protein